MRYLSSGQLFAAPTRKLALLPLVAVATFGFSNHAMAAGTAAGSLIDNTASATYDTPGGGTSSVNSNTVSLKVDELLDVVVTSTNPGDVSADAGTANAVLTFSLTNSGNGNETYSLSTVSTLGGDDFDPTVTAIYIDSNGNGQYDAGVDTLYTAGSNDPNLDADETVTVFVVSSIPGSAADTNRGQIQLVGTSTTGTGAPGTTFAGAGDGGGDAVVGLTGADGSDEGFYRVSAAVLAFTKAATIADQFGGTEPVPGATITYTLTAVVTGSGSLTGVKITDAVPAATTYIANSIMLDGVAQTDAADADPSKLATNTVTVDLGTVAGGSTRVVKFQVRIN